MITLDINSYFEDQLDRYFVQNKVKVDTQLKKYLLSLLNKFILAESIKASTLFEIYEKCVYEQKIENYIYLGDHSLYMSGMFPGFLNTSLVNLDYYVQMGSLGYNQASQLALHKDNKTMYSNMATNFKTYMNSFYLISQDSIMKDKATLYNHYIQSENPEALKELLKMGIFPAK